VLQQGVPDFLHALQVVTQVGVDLVGRQLHVLARAHVLLSVQEPSGDVECLRVGNDGLDVLNLILGQFTGAGIRTRVIVNRVAKP
jgi:hypothetical protein